MVVQINGPIHANITNKIAHQVGFRIMLNTVKRLVINVNQHATLKTLLQFVKA